jgi:hypothetical protein
VVVTFNVNRYIFSAFYVHGFMPNLKNLQQSSEMTEQFFGMC